MTAIKHLQERTSKSRAQAESTQTVEISLKPLPPKSDSPKRIPSPKPPSPKPPSPKPPSPKPPSPKPSVINTNLPEDFIKPGTKVYAIWFDDDRLVYEVNEISTIDKF